MTTSSNSKIRVAIFGGTGYGGSELLRILLQHPKTEIVAITAREEAGKNVGEVHRNLYGLTDLFFTDAATVLEHGGFDVAFLAMPHGNAKAIVERLDADVKAIDLSGDFRIDDAETFQRSYGFGHAGELQSEFVYGQTETARSAIREARFISNPGCFATATILALAPAVNAGSIGGNVIVDAKTGSSGSGVKPAANTHHPQRMTSFYAYKPFTHQHVPEIEQQLNGLGGMPAAFIFMTHSMPVARGIFASCYFDLTHDFEGNDLVKTYRDYYKDSPFVRIVPGSPDVNWVKMTNYCDIAVHTNGRQAVVFSAIDNLVKGAAGQAIQNMNLMFGFDETAGLTMIGTNP